MANIMITECCNLHCPYCFADEFVNKESNYISIEAFQQALAFIKSAEHFDGRVGIIGGEPTVAPNFSELLQLLIEDDEVNCVPIYTNGLLIDKYILLLQNKKFDFLINFNSPSDIGQSQYQHIVDNIGLLIEKGKKSNLALGINLYQEGQDVEYYIHTLKQYGISHARVAITTPNEGCTESGFIRLKRLRKEFLSLTSRLVYEDIHFIVDCNRPPECIWNDTEQMKLELIYRKLLNAKQQQNFFNSRCNPVIDILPDLTAIRCFGLSEISKLKISDFSTIDELMEYYRKNVDDVLLSKPTTEQCRECKAFCDQICYGGCLSNKRCI